MKLKQIALAAALAAGMAPAMADDQTVTFAGNSVTFTSTNPLLVAGDDVITFSGLSSSTTYQFLLSVTAPFVNLTGATLNGLSGTLQSFGGGFFSYAFIQNTSSTPLVLTLTGNGTGAGANYVGTMAVTAVPEPGSMALLLAGMGVVGFIARRRRPQQ